jgi:hypothetical protein
MKKIIFLFIVLFAVKAQAQWINSISIYPPNPSPTDPVLLIVDGSFPSATCDQHSQGSSVTGNVIDAWAMHCVGIMQVICYHTDTLQLGTLPIGNYTVNFQLDHGYGPFPCTPGIVPAPDTSINFSVSLVTDIPDVSAPSQWITVFPNPAQNDITLTLNQVEPRAAQKLTLYNGYGQPVWSTEVKPEPKGSYSISTSHLPSGMYFLRMGSLVRKLVVNR